MQANVTDLISPTIKNDFDNSNNLKELRIVLNRNDCIRPHEFTAKNKISKYRLQKTKKLVTKKVRQSIEESKMRTRAKFSGRGTNKIQDEDTSCNSSSGSEASQQLNVNNKRHSAYYCEVCMDTFQTTRALMLHMHFHIKSNGVIFRCALCGTTFKTNEELINHKLVHDSEGLCFKCYKCKLAYTSHHDYLQHNTIHIKTPLYKCIECSYTFHLRRSYKGHISTHYLKKLKCNYCQDTFTQNKDLARHKRRYHLPGIDCVECGKNCPTRRDHEEHMAIHTGVKAFQCFYCGKQFSKHNARRVHTRIMHTKFTPHECTVCSERFHTAPQLKSHMMKHNTKIKYECDDCGRQFFHRMSMVQHVRQHMNYMLYKCPICKRSYTTYQNLCAHTAVAHIKIRQYKCELCSVSFVLKKCLRKHMKTRKHLNKSYAADLCLMKDEE